MIATPIPRETLLHVVKALPAAPRILAQLGHLLLDPNSEMDAITALLRCDTALTTRIIRISNSAFYNTGTPYASLEEALARVGYTEVYRLTGFAAVSQVADAELPLYRITGAQLRENSLLSALLMESLARRVEIDARTAYTAGLLRSIGKIALDRVTRSSSYKGNFNPQENGPVAQWESQFVGMNNCEAAAIILKEWRFPLETINGIREHYLLASNPSPMAELLNLAAGAAERAGNGLVGETTYWRDYPAKVGPDEFSAAEMEECVQEALQQFATIRSAVS